MQKNIKRKAGKPASGIILRLSVIILSSNKNCMNKINTF